LVKYLKKVFETYLELTNNVLATNSVSEDKHQIPFIKKQWHVQKFENLLLKT